MQVKTCANGCRALLITFCHLSFVFRVLL